MRKIKKLEERIDGLELARSCDNEVCANRYELNRKWLMDIEAKQKEQEEFLKNTVAPFISNSLAKELDKGLTTVIDTLADVFAEGPKKKVQKKSKDEKKVGRPKKRRANNVTF